MKKIIESLILLALLILFIYSLRLKIAPFYYNRGNEYYERRLYEKATAYFRKSLRFNPSMAITHYMLANAYMERNMQDKAIESYKETIRIDPRYIGAYCALGQIYRDNQMYQEALALLKEAEGITSSNQEIKKLLDEVSFEYMADCLDKGTDLFLSGDKLRAYALIKEAVEARPEFGYTHYTLAYLYFNEHNYGEAEKILNKAVELDPKFWPAYKLLGDICFQKGLYEEAIRKYQVALALDYNNAVLHNDLGLALMQMERYAEALVYLKEAIRLDPGNLDIRYSLASTYRDRGMLNESISEYKKIIQVRQDYPNLYNDLGDIYILQKKKEEALEAYQKEIDYSRRRLSANPDDPAILNNLAYAINGLGEHNKAKEIIGKVLALYPKYRQAYLTLAKIHEKLGNSKETLALLAHAKTLSGQVNFIDRDIVRVKRELKSLDAGFVPTETIYLKNGRHIEGRIQGEDKEKVILEVILGNARGNLTFYRNAIERIQKHGQAQ